jgi:heme-degrading monooxygenase HmoA
VTFVAAFRYEVDAALRGRFEQAYGPDGEWAVFFARAPGYAGTELYRSTERGGDYLVLDRWDSNTAYEAFLDRHREEYERRGAKAEVLYRREEVVGRYETAE